MLSIRAFGLTLGIFGAASMFLPGYIIKLINS